jgi:hypothetical protein
MNNFCHSCGMPLQGKDGENYFKNICAFCADEKGKLKSKEDIVTGLSGYLKSWAPKEQEKADFKKRAEMYLAAMPQWAKE